MALLKLPRSISLVGTITFVIGMCFTGDLLPVGAQPTKPVDKTPDSGRVHLISLLLSQ